jgi:hypothetical protein
LNELLQYLGAGDTGTDLVRGRAGYGGHYVLKRHPAGFKAECIQISEVVPYGVNCGAGSPKPGKGGDERSRHFKKSP